MAEMPLSCCCCCRSLRADRPDGYIEATRVAAAQTTAWLAFAAALVVVGLCCHYQSQATSLQHLAIAETIVSVVLIPLNGYTTMSLRRPVLAMGVCLVVCGVLGGRVPACLPACQPRLVL